MAKRLLLVMVALALIATGCGGPKPQGELESSGAGTEMGGAAGDDEMSGMTDDAGRDDLSSRDLQDYDFQRIYFDFDKYALRADARAALDANAEILRSNPDVRIVIEGHCDERGTDEYNLALGEKRARSALDYLVRLGIDESRVTIISYGEERPASLGHDEQSWAQNRRGEFEIR